MSFLCLCVLTWKTFFLGSFSCMLLLDGENERERKIWQLTHMTCLIVPCLQIYLFTVMDYVPIKQKFHFYFYIYWSRIEQKVEILTFISYITFPNQLKSKIPLQYFLSCPANFCKVDFLSVILSSCFSFFFLSFIYLFKFLSQYDLWGIHVKKKWKRVTWKKSREYS